MADSTAANVVCAAGMCAARMRWGEGLGLLRRKCARGGRARAARGTGSKARQLWKVGLNLGAGRARAARMRRARAAWRCDRAPEPAQGGAQSPPGALSQPHPPPRGARCAHNGPAADGRADRLGVTKVTALSFFRSCWWSPCLAWSAPACLDMRPGQQGRTMP
jgi:hypothetical protein